MQTGSDGFVRILIWFSFETGPRCKPVSIFFLVLRQRSWFYVLENCAFFSSRNSCRLQYYSIGILLAISPVLKPSLQLCCPLLTAGRWKSNFEKDDVNWYEYFNSISTIHCGYYPANRLWFQHTHSLILACLCGRCLPNHPSKHLPLLVSTLY